MTIESRGNRWRVIVDVGTDPISHRRQRVTKTLPYGATKKDARDEEARLRLKGKPRARTKTVGHLLDEWFAGLSADDYSPLTLQGYRSHIDRHLIPALGDLPVRKLDVHRIETLYRALRKGSPVLHLGGSNESRRPNRLHSRAPISATTIKRIHATLSGACKAAVRWGWIATSPCPNVDTGRPLKKTIEPPSIAQIAAVLEHADEGVRNAVGLALATGARAGELCGLQWADIGFDNGSVTFRRSIGNLGPEIVVVEDRRKSRIRTVPVDPMTLAMLEARKARQEHAGYVLSDTPYGDPLSPRLLGQRWAKAADRAGLGHVRFHDLRHAVATRLLANRFPVPNTVRQMGWSSDAMVKVYGHAVAELDPEAARILGDWITPPNEICGLCGVALYDGEHDGRHGHDVSCSPGRIIQ